jgi:SAM-dependent methyltransferase
VRTHFDAVAEQYDDSLPAHVQVHYLEKRLHYIRRHVPVGGIVLDVGCGTGVLCNLLRTNGYKVAGIDPSMGMVRKGRLDGNLPLAVVADGIHLPFADGTFDLTYCVAVLHHVEARAKVGATLAEMARVTIPGGYVLVWDHNPRNPYWPLLMRRVPQDIGEERLIPLDEILDGLRTGGARPVLTQQLGLVPDFVPSSLLPLATVIEGIVERVPLARRFCAHNVVLAERVAKPPA